MPSLLDRVDRSTVDALLAACVDDKKDLICAGDSPHPWCVEKLRCEHLVSRVSGKQVVDEDAIHMEEFLNLHSSARVLRELIEVLQGKKSLDSVLREVARLISRNKEEALSTGMASGFAQAFQAAGISDIPNEPVGDSREGGGDDVTGASKAMLFLYVERLSTAQTKSTFDLWNPEFTSQGAPSAAMLEHRNNLDTLSMKLQDVLRAELRNEPV